MWFNTRLLLAALLSLLLAWTLTPATAVNPAFAQDAEQFERDTEDPFEAEDEEEEDENLDDEIENVEAELAELIAEHGPRHPEVRELKVELEELLTEREEQEEEEDFDDDDDDDEDEEDDEDLDHEIEIVERELDELMEEHGPRHPEVRELKVELEELLAEREERDQEEGEDHRRDIERELAKMELAMEFERRHLHEVEVRLEQARAKRSELRERLDEVVMSPGNIAPALERLEMQKLEDELELHGKRGRVKAIKMVVKELAKEDNNETNTEQRMMKAELEGQLRLQEAELKRLRELAEKRVVPVSQVHTAESELQRVVEQLEIVKQHMRQPRQSDQVRHLNDELRNLSVDIAELESRLQFVNEFAARVRSQSRIYEDYERLDRIRIPELEATLRDGRHAIHELEREIRFMEIEMED